MADGVSIRRFEDRDLPAVLEVLRAALGETAVLKRTEALFGWKHFHNPFGRSIILLAESEGRVAGVRAFMRWDLQTPGGDVLRCVRAVDTATHPDFGRRGIFSSLTMAALEEAEAAGVDMVFNTPNEKSGAGYLKMGWGTVGPIGVLVHPTYRLATKSVASDVLPDPAEFLKDPVAAEALDGADRRALGLRTVRSPEYRSWRFTQHPTARYFAVRADDSAALVRPNHRSGRRELVVSELIGPNPRRAAVAARKASKSDYLATWFSDGSPERKGVAMAGFVSVPRMAALQLVARPLREVPLDVFTLDSWDLATSDLELL
ncbi:MAG: GNAT family N-acetyltransferase [Acidimicrobiia bacterium]|nr:GNAT family N-acetyltransferase [Acidimicrobiia bacterium]